MTLPLPYRVAPHRKLIRADPSAALLRLTPPLRLSPRLRSGLRLTRASAGSCSASAHSLGQDDQQDYPTSTTIRGWPYSTACAFSQRILTMRPATSASISFIIFIASMIHSVWPLRTALPSSTYGGASGDEAR